MTNRVVHFEIPADQVDTLQTFYEDVFGWSFENWGDPGEEEEYWMIMTGAEDERGGINGGMMQRQAPEQGVVNTIDVDDIDATIRKIQEHGGAILMEKTEIPDVGLFAYFEDPQRNVFGIMESYQDEPAAEE